MGIIYARSVRKTSPKTARAVNLTSTVLFVFASLILDRIFGRAPDPRGFAVQENDDRQRILPIDRDVRLAIEEL